MWLVVVVVVMVVMMGGTGGLPIKRPLACNHGGFVKVLD
jgi:hypothetical protein